MNQSDSKHTSLIETIDSILQNHYFQTRLQQIIQSKKLSSNSPYDPSSVTGLLDDQYYKAQDQVVQDLVQILTSTGHQQIRNVLQLQMNEVGKQIECIKQDMYMWMQEQDKKFGDFRKQMEKLIQQIKRKVNTSQAMSNTAVVNPNGYTGGIRFLRSGVPSSAQSISSNPSNNQGKSFHSELMLLKKQLEELKQGIDKGEPIRILSQHFNEFKIEAKIAIESLKQQSKKTTLELHSVQKSPPQQPVSPAMKQLIQASIKRAISAQLKVYGSYSDQIIQIKAELQKIEDKIVQQGELHNQYLSNQLKSVWLVLNDMKKNLDEVTDKIGLDSSRDIL